MKLLLLILLTVGLYAETDKALYKELNNLTYSQSRILVKTFMNAKTFDYEYTMTAIAWHESHFGRYMINLRDPSFGVFHNNIRSVANRHNVKVGSWKASRLAESLVLDYDFSFAESLSELKYWDNYYKGKYKAWSSTVMSYNAGFKKENGAKYLQAIKQKIKILKKYFKAKDFAFSK